MKLCHNVHHYRVSGGHDPVPQLDRAGRLRNRHTTTVLPSLKGGWDHSFSSPTYTKALTREIDLHFDSMSKI